MNSAYQNEESVQRISGVVIGVVTSNNDEENLGRVKVTYPWRDDKDESTWARVATMMAGSDRGSFFIPEVGDEVLVAFDHGDIHHPYIVGALWNGLERPPESIFPTGENNIRKIKTRSGHEIIFDDDKNGQKRKIEIHTQAGHKVLLDDSTGQEKIEIVDKSGSNSITIDSTQNAISIKSSMKLSIESTQVDMKASGMMNIEATGNLTIKGAMVMIN